MVEEVPVAEATLAVAEAISVEATTLVVETGRAFFTTSSHGPSEWPCQPSRPFLVFLVCLYIPSLSCRISLSAGS